VFPGNDTRPGLTARLLRLLQVQGVEVHKTTAAYKQGDVEYPAGSYVVRMDQPYCRMADMLLDKQFFNVNDPSPYDDVGWTLGPLFNVKTVRVDDQAVLKVPMTLVTGEVKSPGGMTKLAGGAAQAYLINHAAENALATFRFKNKDLKIQAAEKGFEASGKTFNAGTFIIKTADNPANLESVLDEAGKLHGLPVTAVAAVPAVAMHEIPVPRIALVHTWQSTQNEGWVRIALDELQIPYDYVSVHAVRDTAKLRDKWDVILFGPSSGDALGLVSGLQGDRPMAWKKTPITPNLGSEDSTDDMRGGIELEGVLHLRDFVKDGGLFITLTSSSSLPVQFGLAGGISVRQTTNLWARGSVYKADVADKTSPIVYGYDDTLGVYFSQSPVFGMGGGFGGRGGMPGGMRGGAAAGGRVSGRGGVNDQDIPQGRPRDIGVKSVEEFKKAQQGQGDQPPQGQRGGMGAAGGTRAKTILSFARNAADLLISGGLRNGEELAGTPTLVDAKIGNGHVVMFGFNPMWRNQTQGSYFLVFNAILNYKNL